MKKCLSILLTSVILCLCFIPAYSGIESTDNSSIQPEYDNYLNKLHFYFGIAEESNKTKIAENSSENDNEFAYVDSKSELSNAVTNMDAFHSKYAESNEPIELTVEFRSSFENTSEFIAFEKERETLKTLEDVRAFRKKLAEFSKEYHRNENEINIKKIKDIPYEKIQIIDYAPFIVLDVKKEALTEKALLNLASDSSTANISLSSCSNGCSDDATWIRMLRETDTFGTVTSSLYTGVGANVGILETQYIDPSHENLADKNITINLNNYTDSDYTANHATRVASIISLMAPDANLFYSNQTDLGLGWFIDNGCDIINCSFGFVNTVENGITGLYDYCPEMAVYRYNIDGLFDYQIRTAFLTVVAASGNVVNDNTKKDYNPYGHVTSPGLAHNVITVGGLDCSLGFFDYELEHHPYSCYVTTQPSVKPEISALYDVRIPNYNDVSSGTSFAAPQVTGALALDFELNMYLYTHPHLVKAIIMATAKETDDFTNMANCHIDDKVGAGCVIFDDGIRTHGDYAAMTRCRDTLVTPDNIVSTYKLDLSKRDNLKASIAWNAYVDSTYQRVYLSNYDLLLYDPDGNLVASSTLGQNCNAESIVYKADKTGEYSLCIYINGEIAPPNGDELVSIVYAVS